jgi:hypothetical protein
MAVVNDSLCGMSSLREIAQFRSASLAPVLPDECQVNPGVYGFELAHWLCLEIAKQGIATSYPNQEDWGWYIEYLPSSGSEFAIHCGNFDATRGQSLLSLRRHARKMFGRDKPPYEAALPVIQAIRTVLETASHVHNLEWLYEAADAT